MVWLGVLLLLGCGSTTRYRPVNAPNQVELQAAANAELPVPAGHQPTDVPLPEWLPAEILANLPTVVKESSGLAMRHGRLWTHNDSGGSATLFELTLAGDAIRRRVLIDNAVNVDWEALAQDDTHLFVADCGNNLGDRTWLTIYKVAWHDLDEQADGGTVSAQRLKVRLADAEPQRKRQAHNNDCEALTVVGDELWLFTKNWQDHQTRLYRLDKQAPSQQVASSGEFPVKGLITAADYDPETQRLVLLGYRLTLLDLATFIWLIPLADHALIWQQASYHRVSPFGQWEAILWHQGDLLMTQEQSVLGPAMLAVILLDSL